MKDTTKTQEQKITKALQDCSSWLIAYESFTLSFSTLESSPSFIRVTIPLGGSPAYIKSPLEALPIENILRSDSEEVKARKKSHNYKNREMRTEIIQEEIDRVFPFINSTAKTLSLRVVRQGDSLIVKK
jgi:hypothetical protein